VGGSKTVVTVISKISERPASGEACLVVIYGWEMGKKFNLDQPSIVIGRSSRTDIPIDQESVSRNHAKIINEDGQYVMRDLGSTNGTYINDRLTEESTLRDGDFIKIGRTIFKFLTGSNIENAYHEEIYRLTTVDGLTQVYNKRYFMDTLDREMSRAARYKRPLALVMFDIDFFKDVNDSYGHIAGDFILKQLATLVKENVRREDVMARYGGEEFIMLLPETDLPDAMASAEKLRGLVESHEFTFEDNIIAVTVSVGVAFIDAQGELPDSVDFIKMADEKMYLSKHAGRNQVH
jgi:two-component system cell cycle response regulator